MKKILIVEDDEKIALALSVRLKAHGFTVWVAGDGDTLPEPEQVEGEA